MKFAVGFSGAMGVWCIVMVRESSMPCGLDGATPAELSVVVAAWPDSRGLIECLQSICSQSDDRTEVILVSLSHASSEITNRFPRVRWLTAPVGSMIPHLWSLGMDVAEGSIVAITTTHFEPAADWIARVGQAHARLEAAGIGGRIAPPRGGGAASWATYFLRYSNYLGCIHEQAVSEIAGDNASYKREALVAHRAAWHDGFWEPEFHRLLRADGKTLAFVPGIRVTQRASFSIGSFCRQRFAHGRRFGQARVRSTHLLMRLARVVTSPLIPVAVLGKILWRVGRSGCHFGALLRCLPVLILFVFAWTLGETWGYLTA
jgi:hypothetical protein